MPRHDARATAHSIPHASFWSVFPWTAHREPPIPPLPDDDPAEPGREPPLPPDSPYPGHPQQDPPVAPPGKPTQPPPEIIAVQRLFGFASSRRLHGLPVR